MNVTCRRLPILASIALGAVAFAPVAEGASRIVIKGRGFGHGVGMSQYGAFGFAKNGHTYEQILGHYYTDTKLGKLDSGRQIRVLLQSGFSGSFSGAEKVSGHRRLDPKATYSVARTSKGVALRTSSGRVIATYTSPLRVEAPSNGSIRLGGTAANGISGGRYRGALEFRAGAISGLLAINAVDLEDYVRGVVSKESPSSWPIEALKAQAVAARTYAITTDKPGDGFEHYADVRSQVYGGVAAETSSTDEAVAQTRSQVVTYQGEPVVTYFFSTSGGRTENVENGFLGAKPAPYLKSVKDPYDKESPRHTWGPYRYTLSRAKSKLGGLVKGNLKRIKVIKRGVSPRIVKAQVIGTRGTTTVTGPELRRRFGLYDTWATFTLVTSTAKKAPTGPTGPSSSTKGDSKSGGATPNARASSSFAPTPSRSPRIVGRVLPSKSGEWLKVQRRAKGRWVLVAEVTVNRKGRYEASLPRAGSYRIVYKGIAGPTVRAR
ncbi:SpoIID/LytB domain-containing protein [Paraconexibacter sp.]|uniref:SpoIID/LytB domain-containing protein n=1 Tax=Paraconexibacter sp. TaxID=2949640 RepID=UPI003568F4D9